MPNASLNIGGDASGAIAAVAAAQGAIDGLSGKTVHVDIETRGGAAVAGMAGHMDNLAKAAGRANRATKGFADNMERAGKSGGNLGGGFERAGGAAERAGRAARSMGDDVERAGGHAASMAGHLERVQRAVGAIGSGSGMRAIGAGAAGAAGDMRELESGSVRAHASIGRMGSSAGGMRAIGGGASSAGREVRALESGASRAGVAVRNMSRSSGGAVGGGAIKDAVIDMQKLSDGTYGVAEAMKAIGSRDMRHGGGNEPWSGASASAGASKPGSAAGPKPFNAGGTTKGFSWAGVDPSTMGNTGGFSARPDGTYSRAHQKEQERAAAGGPQAARPFSSGGAAEQLAARKAASGARDAASGIDEVGKSSQRASGSVRGMTNSVTGMGGGLHGIERAIRPVQEAGFQLAMIGGAMAGVTREASKLTDGTTGMAVNFKGMSAGIEQAEQSAARSHNLGMNGMDQELRQTARAMTNELAPAMKAGVQATKSFEEAKLGAQGSMGPEMTAFSNQMTQSAPALQGIMSSLGKSALGLGTDVVAGVAQAAPAFNSLAQSVAGNSGNITAGVKALTELGVGLGDMAVKGIAGFGQIDSAVKSAVRPAQGSGAMAGDLDVGHAASLIPGLGALESRMEPGMRAIAGGGKAAKPPGGFDPSKPYSGTAIGADGSEKAGPGETASSGAASAAPTAAQSHMMAPGFTPHAKPRDDAWASGMTGKQIYESEFQRASGGYPSTGPMPSGLGAPPPNHPMSATGAKAPDWAGPPPGTFSSVPGDLAHQPNASSGNPRPVAGFGSGARPLPASASAGLGMAQPMQSGAAAGAQSGADLGGAMVQHVQKAVHVASAAATSGGQAIGGAMASGAAQGITTNQTVTDTAIIKHLKKVQDQASGPSGIDAHSPSKKYDALGRLIPQGLAQGVDADGDFVASSMVDTLDQAHAAAAQRPQTMTVTAPRKQEQAQDPNASNDPNYRANAMQYSRTAMDQISAHNDRASQLAQGRADNHAIAMANLGATNPESGQKWQDPRNRNPFAGQDVAQVAHPGAHGPNQPSPRVGGPGSTGGGASMPSNIAGGLGLGKVQGPWAGVANDLHSGMVKAGTNSVAGLTAGIKIGIPKVGAAGAEVAGAGQAGYKKADKQSSPSAVWAGMGGNSVAGVPIGFAAGVPAAVSSIGDATQTMSNAIAGPMNNQGLMLGYNYAENIVTGAQTVLKTANFQASGTPAIANLQAQAALGQQGLLGPGAGASIYKTPSVSMGGAGIAAAVAAMKSSQPQVVQATIPISLDGQVFKTIATQIALDQNSNLVEMLNDAILGANG